ncbi:MAG: methyl-accepting chemotaxis protein [Candidatus Methylacidiphilales bacterium]
MKSPSATTTTARGGNISAKIGLAFVAIGILSIVITALGSYLLYSDVLKKSALDRIDTTRVLVQNRIDEVLSEWMTTSISLIPTAYTAMVEAAAPAPVVFEQHTQGTTSSQNSQKAFQEVFTRLGIHRASLYLPNGKKLKSYGPEDSAPLEELVQKCIQQKIPLASHGYAGEASPQNFRFLHAVPMITGEQMLAGVLVTERLPQPIFSILDFGGRPADAGLGQSGHAYLVDRDMKAMSPVRDAVGLSQIQSEGIRNAHAGNIGKSSYDDYRGISVFGSHGRLRNEFLNWAVLVEQSRSEALSPARTVNVYITLIGAGLILVVAVLGAAFAKIFSKPIVGLEETMRRIRSGDESARAEITSNDEIGQLAISFNEMLAERNAAKDRLATENRRLQNNIQDLLLVVADASEGKLSVRARKTEGVLGNVAEALNQMLLNVGQLIGEAKRVSAEVEQAAAGITRSANRLTEGATDQTRQVNNTIQDVRNLAEESRNVSENSKEAAASAARTREAAEHGARSVRDAIEFMERLRQSVQDTAAKIDALGQRSKEISGIVRSISEISAETDVLAMNASIEAARAGEHGRGFTIVADQVRALADRTRLATLEIEKLVHGIQTETDGAVRTMENQTREVEQGTRQVGAAGQSLGNIVEVSVDSSTLAGQISDSAAGQEKRAAAVLESVRSINAIAEETRAKTVEFQQTSDQLARLASALNSQLANFETATAGESSTV